MYYFNTVFLCFTFFIKNISNSMYDNTFTPGSKFTKQIRSRLNDKIVKDKQHKREDVTWKGILFSSIELFSLFLIGLLPSINQMTFFSFKSIFACLLTHVTLVEFIYYWIHLLMHHPKLYPILHKHHHLSVTPTPKTSVTFLPLEHLFYDCLFALPIIVPFYFNSGSIVQTLFYIPMMDFVNTLGHTNVELFSIGWHDSFMGKFFYSTTYHHIHHKYYKYNYALFVPIYDILFGTYNVILTQKEQTLAYYKQNNEEPKYAFFIHIIDKLSMAKTGLYSEKYTRTNNINDLDDLHRLLLPVWNIFY